MSIPTETIIPEIDEIVNFFTPELYSGIGGKDSQTNRFRPKRIMSRWHRISRGNDSRIILLS